MSIFGIKGFGPVTVIRPKIVAPCNAGAEARGSARGAAPRSLPHATITSRALTTEAIARLIVPLLVLGGRTCTQGRQKGCVPTVDVPAELDRTVLVGPGGPIEQVDRNRFGQRHGAVHRLAQRAQQRVAIPPWIRPEQIQGELDRPLNPDAAMAEVPLRFLEQRPRGRVVQVDVVLVEKQERKSTRPNS